MMKTTDSVIGKWRGILTHFGMDESFLQNRHGPCPLCGGKDRYRWDNREGSGSYVCSQCGAGQGMTLLMRMKGWDFKTACAEVDKMIGNVQQQPQAPAVDPMKRINLVTSRLRECSPEVRAYLAGRNLKPSKSIKSAVVDYYDEGVKVDEFHCMVCPVQDRSGALISYHITYLDNGKKANVKSPKKMLPPCDPIKGGAVRLTAVYPKIGIAEGIETALAVMEIFKLPCWAGISANILEQFQPPDGVNTVIVFGDNDENFTGQKAAYTLANRLSIAGYATGVFLPEKENDFADVLNSKLATPAASA